jgi:hypothetical protein
MAAVIARDRLPSRLPLWVRLAAVPLTVVFLLAGLWISAGFLAPGGNKGTQQYSLPADLDVDRYSSVVIWCRAFTVGFAKAELQRS